MVSSSGLSLPLGSTMVPFIASGFEVQLAVARCHVTAKASGLSETRLGERVFCWDREAHPMPIPYFSTSGRRPHIWRIRGEGWRELLLSKQWVMRGAYATKQIRRRQVVVTIVEKHDDYFLCRFQLKDDLWADISAESREREALQRRSAFELVQATASEATDSDVIDSEFAEDDEAVGIGLMFASPQELERACSNNVDYLDSDGKILAERIFQREATGLILDREQHERLARQAERWLEKLRSAVSDTEYIHPTLDYEAGVLLAEFYPEAMSRFLSQAHRNRNGDPRSGDPDFNALADRLQLWRADFHGEATLELRVRTYFSVTHALAALEELAGVMFADVLAWGTKDEPDIAAAPAETDAFAIVVRGAYNQRTFKTTSRRYRFFLVSDAGVTQLSAQEASRSPSFRTAVVDRPWRRNLRWPAKLANGN